jgi:hypothetical protein
MQNQLVVTANDFTWTEKYTKTFEIFVQQKTRQKEPHIYLQHIIQQYPNYPDKIIFISRYEEGIEKSLLNFSESENDYSEFSSSERLARYPELTNVYEDLFNKTCPNQFCYQPNASFGISKKSIYKHPINFYRQCLKQKPKIIQILWSTIFYSSWCGLCDCVRSICSVDEKKLQSSLEVRGCPLYQVE